MRDKLFGRKTEKIYRDDGQLSLFDIPEPECPILEEPEETTVASKFLNGYQGIVQTDGYAGYNFLDTITGIIHVACWIHARRKFTDVLKAAGIKKNNQPTGNAWTALKYISKLYKIEKEAREQELSADDLYRERQEKAVPILNEFKKWLDARVEQVPPKSLLSKAISYTLNQWPRLIRYTEDGRVGPDNNVVLSSSLENLENWAKAA